MAEWTTELPQIDYRVSIDVNAAGWNYIFKPANIVQISSAGIAGPNPRYFNAIWIEENGEVNLYVSDTPEGGVENNNDLSTNFEDSGSITLVVGDSSVTVAMGIDFSEPYAFIPSNADEVIALYNDSPTTIGSVSGSITLRDFVPVIPPTPEAPTSTILSSASIRWDWMAGS